MEMLKDLGEMVAQAERLGPVSAVESKESPPDDLREVPVPQAPPARPRPALGPLGGGNTTLEDLARRGRSDLDPSLAALPPRSLSTETSSPDWSLDTDSLRTNSVNPPEEAAPPHEPPPSSPGHARLRREAGRQAGDGARQRTHQGPERPPEKVPERPLEPVLPANDPLSQKTERIQTIRPPAAPRPPRFRRRTPSGRALRWRPLPRSPPCLPR